MHSALAAMKSAGRTRPLRAYELDPFSATPHGKHRHSEHNVISEIRALLVDPVINLDAFYHISRLPGSVLLVFSPPPLFPSPPSFSHCLSIPYMTVPSIHTSLACCYLHFSFSYSFSYSQLNYHQGDFLTTVFAKGYGQSY